MSTTPPSAESSPIVALDAIREARKRIRSAIYESPCAHSAALSSTCGADVYFKLENLQRTGSFKERGALNRILTLSEEERARGLITASAGNHAQAVAYHAGRLGAPSTIVMPRRTPLIKVSNTRGYGAEVLLEGDSFDAAMARAKELEAARQLTFVHPFDDEFVIAGQGTIGLELLEQLPRVDMVIVPIGGGGVISGIATVIKALRPEAEVVGVQTAAIPSMVLSLEKGRPTTAPPAQTIADGIAVKRPGELTTKIIQTHVDRIVTVSEEEIANAVLLLLEQEKTVAEGAAAATLAALLHGHIPDAAGRCVVMVLCGGNIDVNLISRIIDRGLATQRRLVRYRITVEDRPGALASLLSLVATEEANVLEVHHQRAFGEAQLGQVEVALTLETRGIDHAARITQQLSAAGFSARELGDPRG